MILKIVTYGHPSLRAKGSKIAQIDERVRRFASDMVETVLNVNGIGLASQQVGLPLQLFVLNVPQEKSRLGKIFLEERPVPFDSLMPMVVINPEIKTYGKIVCALEGCLSFPSVEGSPLIQGVISRPSCVLLHATNLEGKEIKFHTNGLLARAIQHEFDHLQGTLFIDHMEPTALEELQPALKHLLALEWFSENQWREIGAGKFWLGVANEHSGEENK